MNYGTLNGYTVLDSSTVELMTTMYFLCPNAYNESQGLAWYYSHDREVWWHHGAWYGILTLAGFNKENSWGTMELSNGDY